MRPNIFRRLQRDERGAVTVDWMVMMTCLGVMALGIMILMGAGSVALHDTVSEGLTETGVAEIGTMPP